MTHIHRDQIWRNFATFAECQKYLAIFDGLISIWQNFDPTREFFNASGQIYIVVNGQILDK